jgi:7-cyano-7-deazaguanine synthase in queuosine biosynthesis
MDRVSVLPARPGGGQDSLRLDPGVNLYTGNTEFARTYGKPTSLEEDLLTVGAAIFAADLAIKRGQHHHFIRSIELDLPVVNLPSFLNVADDITYALNVLSADAWKLNFTQRKTGRPEGPREWGPGRDGKVLLFSGGLDSFAAAVHEAGAGVPIRLVSHVTANPVVSGSQEKLEQELNEACPGIFSRTAFRVTGVGKPEKDLRFPGSDEREDTQRTRSFMFLCLAALVARREGYGDVVMIAENGQMAIHLPLSAGRMSAFSTHTAHPDFVGVMTDILSRLLEHQITIRNPFLYMTKGEVVKLLLPRFQEAIQDTVSCWKASRVAHVHHCGICIPCLVRRIALESNGISLREYQEYLLETDVSKLDADDEGKRNLVDLCEFVNYFRHARPPAELQLLFPELATSDCYDSNTAIRMYSRFAAEALAVFQRYPFVMQILG